MLRAILHVDMDAFFASVEERERPELKGRPVIVGGRPEARGVVAAANYAARRFGVHSAMPARTAVRLCPQAVFLPPRHDFYARVSQQIRAIFERYTPLVEPLSLDEAFLDVSASLRLFGDAETIGRRIKEEIRSELALVASVGVAPNKFLAKLASDHDKPDGFVMVSAEAAASFLGPLPVTRLWGVGKVAARQFERLGIATVEQLRGYSPALLGEHFGGAGEHFWRLAHGLDERPVVPEQEAKSISHETTFARDISDPAILRAWLLDLTEQVAWRVRRHGLSGRTVHLKVRFADFRTVTRSRTLERPSHVTAELWEAGAALFDQRLPAPLPPVRLIGMGVSGFGDDSGQGSLFTEEVRRRSSALDAAVDGIKDRFGSDAVRRGNAGRVRRPHDD
jgi:DNA polymerase-4